MSYQSLMRKKCLIFCFLLLPLSQLKAQQYGLFNTRTLFDGFENPAQKTFVLDSSRKFASNFFFPGVGLNAANKGNNDMIRRLINEGVYTAKDIKLGERAYNTVHENANIYLFTLKIFKSYKYQKEIGLSWQLRTDGHIDYTNETLAILDNYRRFIDSPGDDFKDAFNNDGYAQSYHQFSLSYRENYNKRLAFGIKLSLLSGITYNRLKISQSNISVSSVDGPISVALKGYYKASFLYKDELSAKTLVPTFKNPGAAIGFGTTYTSRRGVFLMANIKDLGVIRWGKNSYVNSFNDQVVISNPDQQSSNDIETQITDIVTKRESRSRTYSLTNAKADFLVSKTFGFYRSPYWSYTPSILVSKNLFYKGGDAAFINRFRYHNVSLSAIPSYNFNQLFMFGMQGMYQTPNFEVYLGSDNIFKTASQANGILQQDQAVGNGYNGASFYLGLGIRFGNTVEHPQNSSYMPGLDDKEQSFFKRMFSIFSRKK